MWLFLTGTPYLLNPNSSLDYQKASAADMIPKSLVEKNEPDKAPVWFQTWDYKVTQIH